MRSIWIAFFFSKLFHQKRDSNIFPFASLSLYLGGADRPQNNSTEGFIPSQKEANIVYYELQSVAENRILWLKEIFRRYLS